MVPYTLDKYKLGMLYIVCTNLWLLQLSQVLSQIHSRDPPQLQHLAQIW